MTAISPNSPFAIYWSSSSYTWSGHNPEQASQPLSEFTVTRDTYTFSFTAETNESYLAILGTAGPKYAVKFSADATILPSFEVSSALTVTAWTLVPPDPRIIVSQAPPPSGQQQGNQVWLSYQRSAWQYSMNDSTAGPSTLAAVPSAGLTIPPGSTLHLKSTEALRVGLIQLEAQDSLVGIIKANASLGSDTDYQQMDYRPSVGNYVINGYQPVIDRGSGDGGVEASIGYATPA